MSEKTAANLPATESDLPRQMQELTNRVEGNEILLVAIAKAIAEKLNPTELKPIIRDKIKNASASNEAIKHAQSKLDEIIS